MNFEHPSGAEARRQYSAGFGTTEEDAEELEISVEISEKRSSAAKAGPDSFGFAQGLKPPPPSVLSFSAACEAVPSQSRA
jgi:hypothetical protein